MLKRDRIFFLLIVAFCLLILHPLWLPLATGLILAYLCEEPTYWVLNRFHLHSLRARWFTSFAAVTLVQGLFIVPLFLLTWSATNELVRFWQGISGDASATDTFNHVMAWLDLRINPLLASFNLPYTFGDIQTKLRESIQPMLANLAVFVGNALSATPQLMLFLFVSWLAWLYFLVFGREHRQKLLPMLLPWPQQRTILSQTLGDVLRAMILTSIVLSIAQSFLVLIALGTTGIPKYFLWAALSFFLSFVPVFGTAPVMISAAIYLFTQDRTMSALFVLGMSVVIGLADNVLRPLLMKGGSEMSFFWLFLSLVGGIAMFGLAGAVLGPWAFALFIAVQNRGDSTAA